MAQTGLTKWLKRIFSINSLGFIVAVAGLLLAYKQLMRENGGSLTLDVNGEQSLTDIHSAYTICTGEDMIQTNSLGIFPRFTNQTKYAVKEMLLTGELRSDTTLSNYIDNCWSHGYSDGVSTLRYEDTRVYPHTSVPFPFTTIEVSDDGVFDLSNRATYEGSEKPLEFSLNINFIKVPAYVGEDFDGWRARARRRLANSKYTDRTVIYIAHGSTLRIEADDVASEIAKPTQPKATTLPTTPTMPSASSFVLIENLEDVRFEKTGSYFSPIANFTFAAPGKTGSAIAVVGYRQGSDTIDVPWYRRFFKNDYYANSKLCWISVTDTTTHYARRYESPMPNAELLGFAKVNPERENSIIFRNDSIINISDKAAMVVFAYKGINPGGSDWAVSVKGHSRSGMPRLEMPSDEYIVIYCDIPDAEFSRRHHTAWIIITIIAYIFLVVLFVIGCHAVDDDSDYTMLQRIGILLTAGVLAFVTMRLQSILDVLV